MIFARIVVGALAGVGLVTIWLAVGTMVAGVKIYRDSRSYDDHG